MKAQIYKVYCEYFVKAKSRNAVEQFVNDDIVSGEFFEKHILIDEDSEPMIDYDLTKT